VGSVGTYVYLQRNPALTSFSLPAVTSIGSLQPPDLVAVLIDDNALLAGIGLPSLVSLGGPLSIQGNAVLRQCEALAFKDGLVAHGYAYSWVITGNDVAGACTP